MKLYHPSLNQRHPLPIFVTLHDPSRLLGQSPRVDHCVEQHHREHRHRVEDVQVRLRAHDVALGALLVLDDADKVAHQHQETRHIQDPEVLLPLDFRAAADVGTLLRQAAVHDESQQHEEEEGDQLEGQTSDHKVDSSVLLVWATVGLRDCAHDLQDHTGDVDENVYLGDPSDADEGEVRGIQGFDKA